MNKSTSYQTITSATRFICCLNYWCLKFHTAIHMLTFTTIRSYFSIDIYDYQKVVQGESGEKEFVRWVLPAIHSKKLEESQFYYVSFSLHQKDGGIILDLHGRIGMCNIGADMVDLSTKFKSGVVADLIHVNKVVRHLKEEPARIYIPNLGSIEHWKFCVYSANFWQNGEYGSTFGAVVHCLAVWQS